MESEVKLLILIEVQAGQAEKQIQLYNKIKPLVQAEKGCLQYEMNQVVRDRHKFVLFERWRSKADLAMHDKSEHMQAADLLTPTFRVRPATVLALNNDLK